MKRTGLFALGLLVCALPMLADTTRPLLPLQTGAVQRPVAAPADPDHYTFVVSGDNRAAARGLPMPPTAGRIFTEVRLLQPAFVLWTGDSIYGSDDTVQEASAEYDSFLDLAAQATTPVYNTPGNHEIYDRPELATLYEARMGRLYGSFDYGNTHVIAIDTEEVGIKAGIGKEQMEWLRQDLAANRKATNIFVFSHHPLFPKDEKSGFDNVAVRDALHKLFVENGVKHVFSGHEHLYYKSVHDGITYWVSGGGGAPADASPEEGGYQHYVLFEVNGAEIKANILQPWRLFAALQPKGADGAISGIVSNYNDADLAVSMDLPANAAPQDAVATASWTYKGKSHPLAAQIVPSRTPGMISVRTVVPKNRAAVVALTPKSAAKSK